MSSIKNSSHGAVEGTIDYLNTQISQEELILTGVKSSLVSSKGEKLHSLPSYAYFKSNITTESNVQIPSELITKCVATLFMIQVRLYSSSNSIW